MRGTLSLCHNNIARILDANWLRSTSGLGLFEDDNFDISLELNLDFTSPKHEEPVVAAAATVKISEPQSQWLVAAAPADAPLRTDAAYLPVRRAKGGSMSDDSCRDEYKVTAGGYSPFRCHSPLHRRWRSHQSIVGHHNVLRNRSPALSCSLHSPCHRFHLLVHPHAPCLSPARPRQIK